MARPRERFEEHVPSRGWLRAYVEWTMGSESPMVYHSFVGTVVIGASLGRKVWFNKGYYKLYPNMQILLVGPTGRVRKTSAINLGLSVLRKVGVPVISQKTTPEALLEALSSELLVHGKLMGQKDAHAVLAAPELSVLLGKQKYNEGMISILTDLFDSPDEWTYKTKGRGETRLVNVTLSSLFASTQDWLITAIPQDAFGGGYMSRQLMVVQDSTERCYPIPQPPPSYDHLVEELQRVQSLEGEMTLTAEALEWYVTWYAASRKDIPEDEKMAGYHERKPDHILRLGMILAASDKTLEIRQEHLVRASRMLAFLEDEMLFTFKWLGMKPAGQDQERIMRTLRAAPRMTLSHQMLVRKLVFFMNAPQFQNAIKNLLESGLVVERMTPGIHEYTLKEDEPPPRRPETSLPA